MGGVCKAFLELGGKPLILRTLQPFLLHPWIKEIVVPFPKEHISKAKYLLAHLPTVRISEGGETRQETVEKALDLLDPSLHLVVVHDGARPFLSPRLLHRCLEEGARYGAVIPVLPAYETLKKGDRWVEGTIPREGVFLVQTPQVFRLDILKEAYNRAKEEGFSATDDSALVERIGVKVRMTRGERENIKITEPEDMSLAEALLGRKAIRVGMGVDFHRLSEGRRLILGGVEIPHEKGLLGHSDGDVLLHAIADAILGAIGGGDLGLHFPPDDPKWEGADSIVILSQVRDMAREKGFGVESVDCTILAEEPKIAPYAKFMKERIASCLGIGKEDVNIKATTTEGMGFLGRKEGISALAVVLCRKF